MKKVLLCIAGFLFFSLLLFLNITNNLYIHKPPTIKHSTTTNTNVLATETTAKKTYVSREDGYTVAYPDTWTPDLLPPLDTSGSGSPIFSTGPIGNKALGFPSFIKIVVYDNSEYLSLDDFIKKHFNTSLHFKPIIIAGKKGEAMRDSQGTVPEDLTIFGNNDKIYEIIWYQGAEPKITQQQFTQFLADMKFS
jgi:hypothetical protein